MAEFIPSENCDRAAVREWLRYEFFRPAGFALEHGISERSVRHYISLGMPTHGVAHKGSGGIRLSKSAAEWLEGYRRVTCDGRFRFAPSEFSDFFLSDLKSQVEDEAQAYARLFGKTPPRDAWLEGPAGAADRRSWAKKFREVPVPGKEAEQ